MVGQGIDPDTSPEQADEIYADLHIHLARNIAHETACLDGTPVRANHDHDRCRFWGLLASEYEVSGEHGPIYQATHVAWGHAPGENMTTAEAEAAIYVELAAMRSAATRAVRHGQGGEED